ncbi:hypothetical protein ACFW1F_07585 [Streptomyces bungoensis]|uniref:hypothetical protein n=1 Tax=Streptomyces bungoensis TaxID=285568 RepID=UPI00367A9A31
MCDPSAVHDVRVAYEASSQVLALGASRAYVGALAEHQDAALAGDVDAVRAIREARAVFALAAPHLEELQHNDRAFRQGYARRSIA